MNTYNIHSHFVVNSVSFVDGKRFNNTKQDYAMMRKISDRLCEEYGLSVLKKEEKYDKYTNSSVYKELMKDSIDYELRVCRCIMKRTMEIRKEELHRKLEIDSKKEKSILSTNKEKSR